MGFKFNPFTNKFDLDNDTPNFSYHIVDQDLTIPAGQQMTVIGDKGVFIDATLQVDGELILDDWQDVSFPPLSFYRNFSFQVIASGQTVTVPAEQQMVVDRDLFVDGTLEVDGSLAVITDLDTDSPTAFPPLEYYRNFSFKEIQPGQSVNVPVRQEMCVDEYIQVDGTLEVDGTLSVLTEDDADDEFLPWYEIPAGTTIEVKQYREYFLSEHLLLDGSINVDGKLAVGV